MAKKSDSPQERLRNAGHGEVGHQEEAGRSLKNAFGGVDEGGDGGVIASDAAVHDDFQRGLAFDLNGVVRVGSIQVHLEIEGEVYTAIDFGFGALMEAAGLAFWHGEEFGADIVFCDDGVAGFNDSFGFPAERMGDQGK